MIAIKAPEFLNKSRFLKTFKIQKFDYKRLQMNAHLAMRKKSITE